MFSRKRGAEICPRLPGVCAILIIVSGTGCAHAEGLLADISGFLFLRSPNVFYRLLSPLSFRYGVDGNATYLDISFVIWLNVFGYMA